MSVLLVIARQDRVEGSWVEPIQIACCLGLSIATASLLYHLVEVPFRKAVVARFDTKASASFKKLLIKALADEVASQKTAGALVLLLVCGVGIQQTRFNTNDVALTDAIIASSASELTNVKFGDDAVLRGIRVTRQEDDGLLIEAVWKLNSERREIRFLNLLSVENQVVGRGNANRTIFSNLGSQESVLDRVKIEFGDLNDVEKIAIGFFEKGRGFAEVNKGPRNQKKQQLYIWKKGAE